MARILDIKGRRVWDSRGRPTVEAEVIVGRGTTPPAPRGALAPARAAPPPGRDQSTDEASAGRGPPPLASGRAIAPAGASTGSGEAKSIDVPRAVHNINTRIRDALR